ncbi:MAG: multicopper oxidase domain-containing protein, partial [Thermodesulfobacteriota bacterium]
WAYEFEAHGAHSGHGGGEEPIPVLRIPGPVIFAYEGETIHIDVENRFPSSQDGVPHGFAIPGIVESGPIPRGETFHWVAPAPAAGTYLYFDHLNAPINRVMGLHGVLVVLPRRGNTPYSNPTPAVQSLFDHLGRLNWSPGRGSEHFPGHPWDPARTWVWLMSTVDPYLNEQLRLNPGMSGSQYQQDYLAQYFLMNGKSGFFSAHSDDVSPFGREGQPALIRNVNAGLGTHSPHIHGNHAYLLTSNNAFGRPGVTSLPYHVDDAWTPDRRLPQNGFVHSNVAGLDTWSMAPGDRRDLLVPFIMPPDVPADRAVVAPVVDRIARGGTANAWPPVEEPYPLVYPMHSHNELSQTAAGGNYPNGLICHWQVDGPVDTWTEDVFGVNRSQILHHVPGLDGVISVEKAELRLKLNRLHAEGRYSGSPGTELMFFAGHDHTGPMLGRTTVRANGTWEFRGRALPVAPSRRLSVHAVVPGAPPDFHGGELHAVRVDVR